ncbi:MAG: CpsD/CapB family tyrosine-protein kinase [Blastocatellia bacterium]
MGRIFDALQRDQEVQPGIRRDPLVKATQSPELAQDQQIELPDMIGAPGVPRSNHGGVLSYLPEEFLHEQPIPQNGQHEAIETARLRPAPAPRPEATAQNPAAAAPAAAGQRAEMRAFQPGRSKFTPPKTVSPAVSLSLNLDTDRVHPRLVALTEPQSIISEQYRTLRTQIFHEAERRLTQVMVVTSAIAGEGKTSTSLNLAWAVANSKGRRVLLIDSDLRRPSIASYLGIAPAVGLCEVLTGDVDCLDPVIRVHGRSLEPDLDEEYQLYVLPVKNEARNPTELLSGAALSEVIGEYRQYFDFIIIDSPPVTPFADARLLANQADGVLMVIRSETAPYATVERAIEALSPARMLGVVLNGAREDEDDAYYYDYYYTSASDDKEQAASPFSFRGLISRLGFWKKSGRGTQTRSEKRADI